MSGVPKWFVISMFASYLERNPPRNVHSDHDRGVIFIEILFGFLPVLPAWCPKLQQRRCLSVPLSLVVIDSY